MSRYIMRLDDACEKRDVEKWNRMEALLDQYGIKPLVGVIPHCEDEAMKDYPENMDFWNRVNTWMNKGWSIAMHGFNHVYTTSEGGINPVNRRSEFAGLSLEEQQAKIKSGVEILRSHGIEPRVFFAPSHTFDLNTLKALQTESNIRTISDTVAYDVYQEHGFTFVPQQSGHVRKLPFRTVTFCYHPNMMEESSFEVLEAFLKTHHNRFVSFDDICCEKRKKTVLDRVLKSLYFLRRK